MAVDRWLHKVTWWRWALLVFIVSVAAFVFSLLLSVQQDKALVVEENERVLEELVAARAQNDEVLAELAEVKAQNTELRDLIRRFIESSDEERSAILEELRRVDSQPRSDESPRSGSSQPRPNGEPSPSPRPSPSPSPSPSPRPSPRPSPSPSPTGPIPDVCVLDVCVGGQFSRAL